MRFINFVHCFSTLFMKKKRILFWMLTMGLFVTSCVGLQTYPLEVLKPGLLVLPNWMTNVVVLNRTSKTDSDSFNTEVFANSILKSLTKTMKESGQYVFVRIGDASEFRLPNPNERVGGAFLADQSLMNPTSHVLITLDQLSFEVKQLDPFGTYQAHVSIGQVSFNSSWTVYNLIQDTTMFRFRIEDDLEFQTTKQIKHIDSIFSDVADYVADVVAKNLNFRWESSNRNFYYSGSLRMRAAAEWFVLDSFKQASDLWQTEFEKGHFKSKYRAALNQVLYMDMLGKQDSAIFWLKKAEDAMEKSLFGVNSYDITMVLWWKEWFSKRQVETDKLKIYFETKTNQ